jgi:hypothetical protein
MALRAAVERFELVREPIMLVLQVAADDPWILRPHEIWQLNYGVFVLAAAKHRPALEPLLGFLSWAEADAFDSVGDFVRDDAPEVLAAVAGGDGAPIADATLRQSLQWTALDAMHRALGIMTLRGAWPRQAFLEHLSRTIKERLLDHSAQPAIAWSTLAELAACTHLWELAPDLAQLCQSGRVDPEWVSEAELAAIFRSPEAPARFLQRHPEIVDPADRVVRWADPWDAVNEGTRARKFLRVGRNDACHCGSGAKFKRCCGRVQEDWF